ncbi:CHAT domain-containing protein [Actinophytocola xanthii]|uniref:CHAT domain-containing protein n=1 Tax=Actinophytocola xanthii TaxID=1912961 RepID=A0A1Q8CV07_9PSEU|nr:CHAT domain-containing protein [Actinophytocola xanthii]OLF18200.1 hypothetical protein BU204_07630 [Actinophytocola xanthii]
MREMSCRLEFLSDDEVRYRDWTRREAVGRIDRTGLLWRTTEWLCAYLAEGGDCTRTEIELLGRHLYELAFDRTPRDGRDSVRRGFEASFDAFGPLREDRANRMRIDLVFHQSAERVCRLPWEFLFKPDDTGGGLFLAGWSRLVLTRHVPEHVPAAGVPGDRLAILAAYCHPEDHATISSGKVVLDALGDLATAGTVVVESADNPTYEELRERYARVRPQVLHVIAHGEEDGVIVRRPQAEIDRDESLRRAAVRAGDEDPGPVRRSRTVSADDLIAMFGDDPPELVFLQACKGDAGARQGMFSTAQRLVRGRVAAVVAMQYAIVDQDAQQFADHFYRRIREGRSIGDAVTAGRRALGQRTGGRVHWDDRAFGTPVLYLQRDSDGPLLRRPDGERVHAAALSRPETRRAVPGGSVECPSCQAVTTGFYCTACGAPVQCRECANPVPAAANFCGQCGHPVHRPGERAERRPAVTTSRPPVRPGKDAPL